MAKHCGSHVPSMAKHDPNTAEHTPRPRHAWIMMAAFEEDFDEKRGQKLRALKKLPQLVNYRSHDDVEGNCDECTICLQDFQVGQFCQVLPVCSHSFHSDCIDQWLQKKLTCPICRISI
ncbi:unnamed protein product [Lupinus luteus]|uniref:RING-type domain-containing protein n=1 Tax=Lupinus luteus TaxID=3873 RepID=A0AAV1Y523_LUPLU